MVWVFMTGISPDHAIGCGWSKARRPFKNPKTALRRILRDAQTLISGALKSHLECTYFEFITI